MITPFSQFTLSRLSSIILETMLNSSHILGKRILTSDESIESLSNKITNRKKHTVGQLHAVGNKHTVGKKHKIIRPKIKIIPFLDKIEDDNEGEDSKKDWQNIYLQNMVSTNDIFKKYKNSFVVWLESSQKRGLNIFKQNGIDLNRCVPINNCREIIKECKLLYPESNPVLGYVENIDHILNRLDDNGLEKLAVIWLDFNGTLDGNGSPTYPSLPYDAVYRLFKSGKLTIGSDVILTLSVRAGNHKGVEYDTCRDQSIGLILQIIKEFNYIITHKKCEQYGKKSNMIFWHFQILDMQVTDNTDAYSNDIEIDKFMNSAC